MYCHATFGLSSGFVSPSTVRVERKASFLARGKGTVLGKGRSRFRVCAIMPTLYETLGIPKTAKPEQIERARPNGQNPPEDHRALLQIAIDSRCLIDVNVCIRQPVLGYMETET